MSKRMALVADMLICPGGAEKVFSVMCEAFPEADVFTSLYVPNDTLPDFRRRHVKELVDRRIFRGVEALKRWYPLAAWQMGRMRFDEYEVVLSSAAHLGRYINKGRARHISYCYYPFRLLYEPDRYPQIRGVRRFVMHALLPALRRWDVKKAQEVDQFVAISELSRQAIRQYYNRDSEVIHSPVLSVPDTFQEYAKQDFFLVVSRLEPWKMLDVVVDAFRLVDAPLLIVGDGPDRIALERRASSNVRFAGAVSDQELVEYYKHARALIHPSRTEYGLTPIEANAYGTPAICWGVDGVRETLVPYSEDPRNATALFYDEPRPEALTRAVREFGDIKFDQRRCYESAKRFSRKAFIDRLRAFVRLTAGEERSIGAPNRSVGDAIPVNDGR